MIGIFLGLHGLGSNLIGRTARFGNLMMHLLRLINSLLNFAQSFLRALALLLRQLNLTLQLSDRGGVSGFHRLQSLRTGGKMGFLNCILLRHFLLMRQSRFNFGARASLKLLLLLCFNAKLILRRTSRAIGPALLSLPARTRELVTP